jgi:hypothetical protein
MDIDRRLHEAGHQWRQSQGPALRAPKLDTPLQKTPPRRWMTALIPLAASAAVAAMVIGVVVLHGAPASHQVPGGSTSASSSTSSPTPKPTASTSARPSSTVAAPRSYVSPQPSNTVAASRGAVAAPPIRAPFVGQWFVHGIGLIISAGGYAVENLPPDPPCSGLPAGASGCFEQWSESVAYSPDGATATLTIVKVTAVTGGSNSVVAKPSSGFQGQVGDSYTLRFMAPHLMVRTWTQGTFARNPSLWGNPYLCQSGLAQALTSKCGA